MGDLPMQQEAEMRKQFLQQLPNKQCPRCYSMDTKFSYFNNNKLSQERYLCKSCKRHWTHGGKLRNVPEVSAIPKPMPLMSSTFSGVEGGPYKIMRLNSVDQLFGFNVAGSQAGGSHGNISQAAAYYQGYNEPVSQGYSEPVSQGFRAHPAVQQAFNLAQNRQPVQESGQQHNSCQGFRTHFICNPWSGYNGASSSYNGDDGNKNIVPIVPSNDNDRNQLGCTSRGSFSGWPSNID